VFRLEAERGKSAFDFNRRDATAVRVRPLRLPIFSDGVHPMSTTRSIRSDIFVVLLLASIVFLVAALVTYDPADDLAQAPDWLKKIYRPDRLVYPPHLQIRNACGFWGAWFANLFITSLGYGAFFLVAGLITLELALVRAQGIVSPWVKTLGWMLSLLGATTMSGPSAGDYWRSISRRRAD